MSGTKYVMSGGLAFAEDKDMEKLRKLSLKGWHVYDFKFMGYTLEKGSSADYIYSVDYRLLKEGEAEEYFELFASAGWTHIATEGDIHLFRALPGTKPIHSERETIVEKHDHLGSSMKWFANSIVWITVLLWIGTITSAGSLQKTLTTIATILTVVAIPTAWTMITIYKNKWEAEKKEGLAKLMKFLPILFVMFVVAMILFALEDLSDSIRILTSMIIGAIALPMAVWLIISLYQKLAGRVR